MTSDDLAFTQVRALEADALARTQESETAFLREQLARAEQSARQAAQQAATATAAAAAAAAAVASPAQLRLVGAAELRAAELHSEDLEAELRAAHRQLEHAETELRLARKQLREGLERSDEVAETLKRELDTARREAEALRWRPPPPPPAPVPAPAQPPREIAQLESEVAQLRAEIERLREALNTTLGQRNEEGRRADAAERELRRLAARPVGPGGGGGRSPERERLDVRLAHANELHQAQRRNAELAEDLKRLDAERVRQLRELAQRKDTALLQMRAALLESEELLTTARAHARREGGVATFARREGVVALSPAEIAAATHLQSSSPHRSSERRDGLQSSGGPLTLGAVTSPPRRGAEPLTPPRTYISPSAPVPGRPVEQSDPVHARMLAHGTLHLFLSHARGLKSGDRNGFSDPYVKFSLAGKEVKSKVIYKNLNPNWSEVFRFTGVLKDLIAEPLRLRCYDKDLLSSDKLGEASVVLGGLARTRVVELLAQLSIQGTIYMRAYWQADGESTPPASFTADARVAALRAEAAQLNQKYKETGDDALKAQAAAKMRESKLLQAQIDQQGAEGGGGSSTVAAVPTAPRAAPAVAPGAGAAAGSGAAGSTSDAAGVPHPHLRADELELTLMSAAIEDQSAREVYCRFVWAENLIGADPHTVKTESVKGAGSYEWKATFKFKLRSGLSQKHFERSAGQLELVARSKSGWGPWAEELETKVAVGEFRLKNPKGANPLLSTALWQRGVTLTQPGNVPEFGSFAIQMKLRQPFTDPAPPKAAAAVPAPAKAAAAVPAPAKAAAASPASLPNMEAEHEDPNAFANRLVSIEVVNHEIERYKKAVGATHATPTWWRRSSLGRR